MAKCFINGIGVIAAQDVLLPTDQFSTLNEDVNLAVEPVYKELIAPNLIRRMSKGVKMGIYASQVALNEANVTVPDAVITGTGLGCIEDSEKFLKGILDNDEQFLTPTSFIQSTHNTVGAQIALRLQCKGYNFTYVNRDSSFEMALLDGLMQIKADEEQNILVGGIDEVSDHTIKLLQIAEIIRSEKNKNAALYAEGANFFALSNTKQENTYAEVVDVTICNQVADVNTWITEFLAKNNTSISEVDAVIMGINNTEVNAQYNQSLLAVFQHKTILHYKHLIGQFDTASAYGLGLAAQYMKHKKVSDNFIYSGSIGSVQQVLLVNQNFGKDYSLVLLKEAN